jgi:hypothetical protein
MIERKTFDDGITVIMGENYDVSYSERVAMILDKKTGRAKAYVKEEQPKDSDWKSFCESLEKLVK